MENVVEDPIIAIATARGNAGVGIIRISASDEQMGKIIPTLFPNKKFEDRKATLSEFYSDNNELLDTVLCIYFKEPRSYTGESVFEIQSHGGQVLTNWILEQCLSKAEKLGLRMAEPGEFTERAFLNGKIDLVQAEAVADLIEATSKSAIKAAARSLKGLFSQRIFKLNEDLIHLRMEVEAILDFPEEEIEFIEQYECKRKVSSLIESVEKILSQAQQGELLRDGLKVVFAGPTNVGKSSLMNKLAGEDLAIVSDVAGTTRDKIQTLIHIEGIPFHVVDTAGIRETEDKVEKLGIDKSKQEVSKADVVLFVNNANDLQSARQDPLTKAVLYLVSPDTPVLQIANKVDLLTDRSTAKDNNTVYTSAYTGEGIEELKKRLLQIAGWNNDESVFIARERHIRLLRKVLNHLYTAQSFINSSAPQIELFAEELRLASDSLGEIAGKTTSDDLLGKIFAGFCIGK